MGSDSGTPKSARELLEVATVEIKRLKALNRRLRDASTQPIAVIGLSCRLPGGATPAAFWRSLDAGLDAIAEIPETRWPRGGDAEGPGLRYAGLIADVDAFDAAFFEISPREAEALDPQQRLVLEVAYEALETAGLAPERLAGSNTAVHLGIATIDHRERAQQSSQRDRFSLTGNVSATAAGRVAYSLGLMGPAITYDTACSSSLIAVHAAIQSLRLGETDLALAGGVNALLSPTMMALLGTLEALSVDGRCKTFDWRANGFVRGEGCGFVVLKRLSDAERDGDVIRAVLRGSAANQDGQSAGLTAPNLLAQQALITRALANAGVQPGEVGYVEAHGTGTSLGDPIELEALKATVGQPRADGTRCALGSVKTNIGHLEAAAGIAGIIKTVLALENERFPKHLHFEQLNPRVSFDGTPFFIAVEATDWPRGDRPRIAGISSFALSGTNCHVVMQEAPPRTPRAAESEAARLVVVSAKTEDGALAQAGRWGEWIQASPAVRADDVAFTAAQKRSHHAARLAVVGRNVEQLSEGLSALARGELPAGGARGNAEKARRVVFVFSGHGSQWVGMARGLASEAAFADSLRACGAAMKPFVDFSLEEVLSAPGGAGWLERTEVVQPTIWAIQVSLAALWEDWGARPWAVVGHSMGEVGAACAAGLLSLDAGARVICRRSQIVKSAPGPGGMAVVELPEASIREELRGMESALSVAVVNSERSTLVAGEVGALDVLLGRLTSRGVFCRKVKVDYASHSPLMDGLKPRLLAALDGVRGQPGRLTMLSSVTADALDASQLTADYWVQNLRQPVLFGRVLAHLRSAGPLAFVELSPHPVLAPVIEEATRDAPSPAVVVSSLRRDRDDRESLLEAAGRLHVCGVDLDLEKLCPAGRLVDLPTYAWQHQRFLLPLPSARPVPAAEGKLDAAPDESPFLAIEWRRVDEVAASGRRRADGEWLLIGGEGPVAGELKQLIEREGGRVHCLDAAAAKEDQALRERFSPGCRGVVLFGDVDPSVAADASATRLLSVALPVVQALVQQAWRDWPRLTIVTRGAQAIGAAQVSPAAASLWGFGRAAALEHPELWVQRVDLASAPSVPSAGEAQALLRELLARDPDDEVAIREDSRFSGVLVRAAPPQRSPHAAPFDSNATYLISGGQGGLGLSLAEWMVAQGARSIAIASRRGPTAGEPSAAIARMEAAGATVRVLATDVTRADEVRRLVAGLQQDARPLRGVFHAAAVLDDGLIAQQSMARFERVLAPKVQGAWNLHVATAGQPLDHFVLFSSGAALLGSPGQSSYCAANGFMDALAHHRRASGLPGLSVNWGVFSSVGLAAEAGRSQRLQQRGLGAFTPAEAWERLGAMMGCDQAQVAFAPIDVRQYVEFYPQIASSSRWRSLLRAGPARALKSTAFRDSLVSGPFEQSAARLLTFLGEQVGFVLRMEPSRIETGAPFKRLGLDSLGALELRNRIENGLGLRLPATLAYTYPDLSSLRAHLLGALRGGPPDTASPAVVEQAPPSTPNLSELSDEELAKLVTTQLQTDGV